MQNSLLICAAITVTAVGGHAIAQDAVPKPQVDLEAIKAESEARKAVAEARKAEADASAAAAKAQFGDLASVANAGTTKAGDKAGQIEAAILSTATVRSLASRIVSDICTRAPELCVAVTPSADNSARSSAFAAPISACSDLSDLQPVTSPKLYLVTETEKPTFDAAEGVQAALCGLQRRLDKAISDSDRLKNGGAAVALAPAAIFTLLNIAGNLFRSEYDVQGVAITPDDALLAKSVAATGIGQIKVPVVLPSLYRPAALTADNPLVAIISQINELRVQAAQLAREHNQAAEALKKKGKAFAKQSEAEAAVAAQLEAVVKSYDDYLTKIATPSEKGTSELAEAGRQAKMRVDLASGSYLLSLKMNAVGGSSLTKKNFWTFLGSVPFFVSGGATGSYVLFSGKTGEVVAAGAYGAPGGFKSIGKIHRNGAIQ